MEGVTDANGSSRGHIERGVVVYVESSVKRREKGLKEIKRKKEFNFKRKEQRREKKVRGENRENRES
jgi:hypothetical protein